jgi:GTP-dependent phosphoenolpyruvate carboxykinase
MFRAAHHGWLQQSHLWKPQCSLVRESPQNVDLTSWVEKIRELVTPENVFWCDGSEEEKEFLTQRALDQGVLTELNQEKLPGATTIAQMRTTSRGWSSSRLSARPSKDEAADEQLGRAA